MTDKKKLEAIEEAFNYYHDRTSLTRLEEKELTDFVYELKAAINYTHSCTELPIYMTCDEDDGQVFAAFTSNERCEIEAEESGTATQMTTLYFGERK